ncbi:MAG TPA: ABC transporter permease [Chthoniobacter sp.]|jgi:putative ABC transport system permease protein
MTFLAVIIRGLFRRPVRTGLTMMGIAIGIAAVVALVGMSRGFESSWANGMKSRGTDVVVSNVGGALTPKPFSQSLVDRVKPLPHVAETCALLVDLTSVEKADMMIVSSRQWGGFDWQNLKIVSGRLPKDAKEKAVVLGTTAAETLQKKVGDTLQLETEELAVVGIVDGGAFVENGSVILSLELYQEITGNEGKINVIDVRATPGTTKDELSELCQKINAAVPEVHAVLGSENMRDSQALRVIRAMSWGTSSLAILVGVLGVMNTMLMTVFERTQEISVLLAIGWKRLRIVRMILYESALLGFLGGLGGVVLGVIGVKLLVTAPVIRGLLEPDLSAALLARAVAISVLVGIFSGLYPAWRSSRLMPSQALHG